MTREQIRFAWLSSSCLSSLNRCQVVPLYTQVDARRFTVSRGRIINVSSSVFILPILQYKFHTNAGSWLRALNCFWALDLSSFVYMGFKHNQLRMKLTRPFLAGLRPVVISPTLGPRLIWTGSCQFLVKTSSSTSSHNLVNHRDIIFSDRDKPSWRHLFKNCVWHIFINRSPTIEAIAPPLSPRFLRLTLIPCLYK